MTRHPLIYSDFPDPDIIRVGDTYYMISTTMHFFPGASVLRSYDLLNWELIGHVYEALDNTPAQQLQTGNIYGQGMWAPSFRYHRGTFYLCFAANDTKQTYLFTTQDPAGPWKKQLIEGFYHDSSLLFDDDGRVYLVYGNRTIHLLELNAELTAPKPDGLSRIIVQDTSDAILGYEGAHLHKHNGCYYLFFINWPRTGTKRRTAWCFKSDTLDGEFVGRVIIDHDLGFFNNGVAQGGMIDTPAGAWYLFMFQDRGAVGRVPILLPMVWDGDGYPAVADGGFDQAISTIDNEPTHVYTPLNASDDFRYTVGEPLKPCWQFNHQPHNHLWSVTDRPSAFRLTTGQLSVNLTQAPNTLTQRTTGPVSTATVTLDAAGLQDGDYAGLCTLQGCYAAIAVTREQGQYYLLMFGREADYTVRMGQVADTQAPIEYKRIALSGQMVTLRATADFTDLSDQVTFEYLHGEQWVQLGPSHKLHFRLDHFTGCRFGLFNYATQSTGGVADFLNFHYTTASPHA